MLFFTASDFTFTSRHIHCWASFLLWPSCFILSEAIHNCPLLSLNSVLGTFQPGGLIFQCLIFLPFHTVHGALKARTLKWLAIFFSSFLLLPFALVFCLWHMRVCVCVCVCVYVCVCVWYEAVNGHIKGKSTQINFQILIHYILILFSFIQDKVKAYFKSPYFYEFEDSLKLQGSFLLQ